MNRAQYRALRKELRRQLGARYPSMEEQHKRIFAVGHYQDGISTAQRALDRLNGVPPYTPPTQRQSEIARKAKSLAIRRKRREAVRALRAAGADEAEVNAAIFRMGDYGMNPDVYIRRAAEMMGQRP